jgi:hypothetical protein
MRLPSAIRVVCTLTLFLAGCKATSNAAAGSQPGSAPAPASASTATATATATATQSTIPTTAATATINDPASNNEPAFTVTIPSGWKVDGTVMINPCNQLPSPVFRAYASDGLTEMRIMPVFGWRWSQAQAPPGTTQGCLPLSGQMSAAQFAQYYIGTITGGVHVVGTMPISAQFQQAAQNYANGMNANNARLMAAIQADNTADTAALHIQTVNGSFVIDQRIRVKLECATRNSGPFAGGTCLAWVDVLRAQQGKLDPLVQLVDNTPMPKITPVQQWFSAFLQKQQQQATPCWAHWQDKKNRKAT